jgi:hypothetical protein
MPAADRHAPIRFLRTLFEPTDWVAVFLKSYERSTVAQRVGSVSWVQTERFQRWLRAMNAGKYNAYVAWNWGACLLLFWRQFAPSLHGVASVEEQEVRMREHDVRWDQYPTVGGDPTARAWLIVQAGRNLASHTVETYGRSMEDFLRFAAREGIHPDKATREHLATYVRDLLARKNPRQPKVVHIQIDYDRAHARVQCLLTRMLHQEQSTYWAWLDETWRRLIGQSRRSFNANAPTDRASRAAFLGVAFLLKRPIPFESLGKYGRVALADRVFGRARIGHALDRLMQALVDWGPFSKRDVLFLSRLSGVGVDPRRLDAARAFAQPRSLRARIGPQPRVLTDDVGAKLLWAGLNLEERDLPAA